jgi:hypothetical protein
MVKRAAAKAGINEAVSPHWLRHAHGSHANRPWCLAARGSDHPGSRQHRHHQWLSSCPSRHIERPTPRSWGVPSMKRTSVQVAFAFHASPACSGGRHPGRRAWQHATSDPRLDGGPAWAPDWAQGLM